MTYPKRPWIFLTAAVVLTYANVYGNEFLFDDEFLILKNTFLDSFANLGRIFTSSSTAGAGFTDSFYRPLQTTAYLIVNQIFGREPWAFHALNVALHALNANLVYALARRLGLTARAAGAGALLWAVHPLHVEAVTYASATADTLHALFTLAALLMALRGRPFVGLILGAAAMLSKESAVVLPALLTACVFARSARPTNWRSYVSTLPYWALSAAYFVVRRGFLHFADADAFTRTAGGVPADVITRACTALAALPAYLGLLLWPHDLRMDRDFPVVHDPFAAPVALGIVMVGLGAWAVWRAARRPAAVAPAAFAPAAFAPAAFAALWVLAAHAPHAGVLIPVNSVFLEHWMYLTSVPLFLSVGRGLDRLAHPRRRLAFGVTAALAMLLMQKTWRQNGAWATPVDFFSRTLAYNPTSARIRHNLAMTYSARGDDDHALEQYELMIKAGTPYAQTFHNAAFIFLNRNQLDRAEPYFLRALEIDPRFYPSAQNLAVLYANRGDQARAQVYLDLYRRLNPPTSGTR